MKTEEFCVYTGTHIGVVYILLIFVGIVCFVMWPNLLSMVGFFIFSTVMICKFLRLLDLSTLVHRVNNPADGKFSELYYEDFSKLCSGKCNREGARKYYEQVTKHRPEGYKYCRGQWLKEKALRYFNSDYKIVEIQTYDQYAKSLPEDVVLVFKMS